MHYYDEIPLVTIAEQLGKPEIWVRRRWREIRMQLQQYLSGDPR